MEQGFCICHILLSAKADNTEVQLEHQAGAQPISEEIVINDGFSLSFPTGCCA